MVLDNTGLAVLALLCALLHELGHLLTIFLFKIPVDEISLQIFGASIRLKGDIRISYSQEILISLSGPAANLLAALITGLFLYAGFNTRIMELICVFNIVIAIFNLLPIGSLDGGRTLECILYRRLQYSTVQKVTDIVSAVTIFPLSVAGVIAVIDTGYNVTLIIAAVYLLLILLFKGKLIIRPDLSKKT